MSSYAQRTRALMAVALLAVALAFGLAFAMSFTAQAEEGDSQDAPLTAQAAPDAFAYSGDTFAFIKDDGSQFGMYKPSESVDNPIQVSWSDGKIHIVFYPKTITTYTGMYMFAGIGDTATWKEENYVAIADGKYELTLDKSYAGKAWPVVPVKANKTDGTSSQYYMAIPPLDKIAPATYDLKVKNSEKMFVGVKATLTDKPSGDDELTFYLNGSSYTYAYAGGQDEAVAAKDAKSTDKKWGKQGAQATFEEVSYETYTGADAKATQGYPYTVSVAVPSDAKNFTQNVTVISGSKKTGGETADNYHARAFAIDLDAKTLTIGNASDSATLAVKSNVADVSTAEKGTLDYKGYVRPYAGATLDDANPLSNDWTGTLTVNLGSNTVYDQAYAVTFEGKPWLAEDAKAVEATEADYVKVAEDGTLALPIANEYDTDPKTTQLNGNIIKVMMHVKADADSPNKDQWLERTFKLDFTSRTAATLTISDSASSVMYRLYNPNSGEHFYTASEAERDAVVAAGWNYEGTAWTAPVKSATPVYRVYSGTDHHYTMDEEEKNWLVNDIGWSDEGVGWYSDDAKGVPLYRVFNPNVDPTAAFNNSGSHHYTTNAEERDALVSVGWQDEGIAWYGVK